MPMTKEELLAKVRKSQEERNVGIYLPNSVFISYTLDNSDGGKWLESLGFTVTECVDVGTNGWAKTEEGLWMSTNTYTFIPDELRMNRMLSDNCLEMVKRHSINSLKELKKLDKLPFRLEPFRAELEDVCDKKFN